MGLEHSIAVLMLRKAKEIAPAASDESTADTDAEQMLLVPIDQAHLLGKNLKSAATGDEGKSTLIS